MSRDNTLTFILDFSPTWYTLPPLVAVITVIVTSFFSSDVTTPVDEAMWALVGLLFIVLSTLYGIFIRQRFFRGLVPVQIIAQGLLLCPLSLWMGARMEWLGVTMAVCGTVALVVIYYRIHAEARSAFHIVPSSEFSALPLLCATTDGEGRVISVSDALLQLTHRTRQTTEGSSIASFLPLDRHDVTLDGREWEIFQSPMEGGMFYFQLEEARHEQASSQSRESAAKFTDPATSLYVQNYAERRINEELYRVRRYKRYMSAVLLRMTFQGTAGAPEKEDEIFNAYCRYVKANTRESDVSCLVGPRDVLVMMPETQLSDAVDVTGKLADFVPHIQEQLTGFDGAAEIKDTAVFVDSSMGDLDFDGLLEKLDNELNA